MKEENEEDVEDDEEEERARAGVLKNTGILNFKDYTEEVIDELRTIKNTGILIVPKKLAGKILGKAKNTGIIVLYTEGSKLYMGATVLDADSLKSFKKPVNITQLGKLSFEDDVTSELIKEKIESISNYGKINVSKDIYGQLMAKVTENAGKIEKIEDE